MGLHEYREENVPIPGVGETGNLVSPTPADEDDALSSMSADPGGGVDDPNVVILRVFEEPARRPSAQLSIRPIVNTVSPAASHSPMPTVPLQVSQHVVQLGGSPRLSMLDIARSGGPDAQLLQHYRTKISPYILRAQILEGEEDLFEVQARSYPPVLKSTL